MYTARFKKITEHICVIWNKCKKKLYNLKTSLTETRPTSHN